MEAIVFIIFEISFRNAHSFENWGYLVNKPLRAAGMSADNVSG